jgi:hypothetical protein
MADAGCGRVGSSCEQVRHHTKEGRCPTRTRPWQGGSSDRPRSSHVETDSAAPERRRRTAAVAVAGAAAVLLGAAAAISLLGDGEPEPTRTPVTPFLTRSEALRRTTTIVVTGTHDSSYEVDDSAGLTYDMRRFASTAYRAGETAYPLTIKGARDTYVIGPTIQGSNPANWTWQRWEEEPNTGGAMWLQTSGTSAVYGLVADNVFDFFKPRPTTEGDPSASILIADSYGSHIHDDCIENDYEMNVTVRNVVCNGSHMGISIAQDSATPGVVTTVEDTTIILSPRPNEKADDGTGHAVLFKQLGAGTIDMRNVNVCYTEDPLEAHKLTNWPVGSYADVTIVLGADFTMPLSAFGTVPPGVAFSRDWSICTDAVTSWEQLHRGGALPGDGDGTHG